LSPKRRLNGGHAPDRPHGHESEKGALVTGGLYLMTTVAWIPLLTVNAVETAATTRAPRTEDRRMFEQPIEPSHFPSDEEGQP
jgi:hypothetical protein